MEELKGGDPTVARKEAGSGGVAPSYRHPIFNVFLAEMLNIEMGHYINILT